ncbi:2-hydroxychromene-2-carboxylate isomerase [Pseudohalocynthiibacter aestuariivivens]|nr:2-hydroxychromene-2-carboxylate isomerase [Pseudohalocynthiibacter aestuariivivens]QIE45788.1 2-hydroxychromene-2-carboxylate isomerase [Pseudohalocynthiibacter aestuariivivens]
MTKPKLEFWFEFASTYSYLSAMRLPAAASNAGVEVHWRPFLLGPIFAVQGWDTSPFNIYAAKGRYMWRDLARRADRLGLTVEKPDPFPQNGILAARVAQIALERPEGIDFCQTIYRAQFSKGLNISDPSVVAACADAVGLPDGVIEAAQSDTNKLALRQTTDEATRRGLFGAPSFLVGDELFWGDDRMEDALDWAVRHAQ